MSKLLPDTASAPSARKFSEHAPSVTQMSVKSKETVESKEIQYFNSVEEDSDI